MAQYEPPHNQSGHFNSGSSPFGGPPAVPSVESPQMSSADMRSSSKPSWSLSGEWKKLKRDPARQAFYAAVWYGAGGITEMAQLNEQMGAPELTAGTTLYVLLVFGLPSVLMITRRGYVSAGIMCLVAIMNMMASIEGMNAGLPGYDIVSVLTNVFFLSIFARAAASLWKHRNA